MVCCQWLFHCVGSDEEKCFSDYLLFAVDTRHWPKILSEKMFGMPYVVFVFIKIARSMRSFIFHNDIYYRVSGSGPFSTQYIRRGFAFSGEDMTHSPIVTNDTIDSAKVFVFVL